MATKPTKSPSETWAKLDAFTQRIMVVCAFDARVRPPIPVDASPLSVYLPWLVRAVMQRDRHAFRGDVGAGLLDLVTADVVRVWSDHDGATVWAREDVSIAPPVQGERMHWMIVDPAFMAWVKVNIDLSGQRKAKAK